MKENEKRKRKRGASTISQQTAKNVFHRQVGRNPVERHPLVMPCGTFSFKNLLHASDNHQRRDVHRHKTINHYHYSSGYKEEEQQIADYPQGVGKLHGRRMITIVRLQRS